MTLKPAEDPLQLRPHTSVILRDMASRFGDGAVRVEDLVEVLRTRAYGALFFLLALLGVLPGISVVAGILLIFFAAQMAAGRAAPRLPRIVRRATVQGRVLKKWLARVYPPLVYVERFVRPRAAPLTHPLAQKPLGVLLILLGLALMVPVPFSQLPPAIGAMILSLALLERDGVVLLVGLAGAAGSLFLAWLFLVAAFRLLGAAF